MRISDTFSRFLDSFKFNLQQVRNGKTQEKYNNLTSVDKKSVQYKTFRVVAAVGLITLLTVPPLIVATVPLAAIYSFASETNRKDLLFNALKEQQTEVIELDENPFSK
ncbi:MAG: hypothetical protein Tsb0021_08830 [Chlamydiales bacterium]